jgi:hypothetical protein
MTRETLIWLVAGSLALGFAIMVWAIVEARADCYTPLTCLYGDSLGRSMEYDRQRREIEDLQSRQRELELQRDLDRARRQREIDLDAWRRRDPPSRWEGR